VAVVAAAAPVARADRDPASTTRDAPRAILEDRLVATVNQDAMTEREMLEDLREFQRRGTIPSAEDPSVQREFLRQWAAARLFVAAGKAAGIPVSETDVQREVEAFFDRAASEDTVLSSIYGDGHSITDLKESIREGIVSSQLRLAHERGQIPKPGDRSVIPSRPDASPQEIRDYYLAHEADFRVEEAVKCRYVVLARSAFATDAEADAYAARLRIALEKGAEPSEALAAEAPPRADSATTGSFPDWMTRKGPFGDKAIVEVAFDLLPGEWSKPLRVGERVLLLQCVDWRKPRLKPFEEVQEQIAERLYRERSASRREASVRRLQRAAYLWPSDVVAAERP
jgi:hypothetical protein